MAEATVNFNPAESPFAAELYKNQDMNKNRYFIDGENSERIFLDEVLAYIRANYGKFPLVIAVANGPLNKILVIYYQKVSLFMPKNKKINVDIFIKDLNRFLNEDLQKTKKSTTKYNAYLAGIVEYMTNTTNECLKEAYGDIFENTVGV